MSSPLTAAEAWALAAKVYAVEALRSGPVDAVELRAQASALLDHARKLDDSADLCVRAQAYLERKVAPGAHYAPRKPSHRRGTKPTSLPETMNRAAQALKEP
jgi:hypothetical protein